jgi:large repetitive protein
MPIPGVTSSSDNRQPGTPTIGAATAGNASASIAFTAPDNTGKPNTSLLYTATTSPSSITGTSSTSPITISGLSNGTSYTAVVKLNNTVQDSLSSAASNSFTPTAPPFFPSFAAPPFFPFFPFFPPFFPTFVVTPSFTFATAGYPTSNSMTLDFGANNAGSYTITASPGGATLSGLYNPSAYGGLGMSLVMTGLSPSTSYTFTYTLYANNNFTGSTATTNVSNTTSPSITNLAIVPAYNGGSLSWSSIGQASYSITTSPTSNLNGSTGNTGTSRTMTGGVQFTEYTVTVTVYSGASQTGSSASATIVFTTPAAP